MCWESDLDHFIFTIFPLWGNWGSQRLCNIACLMQSEDWHLGLLDRKPYIKYASSSWEWPGSAPKLFGSRDSNLSQSILAEALAFLAETALQVIIEY